eukprot:scaffold8216_cov58-Isochrysis_galbana.AAC.2
MGREFEAMCGAGLCRYLGGACMDVRACVCGGVRGHMNISVRVKEGPEDCEASRWSSPAKREETMAARWGTSGTMKARYLEGGTGHEGRGAGRGRIPDTYLRGST